MLKVLQRLSVTGYYALCDLGQSGNVVVDCDFHRIGHGVKVPRLTSLLGKIFHIHCMEYVSYTGGRHTFDIFYTFGCTVRRRLRYNLVILRKEGSMYRDIDDEHTIAVSEACSW